MCVVLRCKSRPKYTMIWASNPSLIFHQPSRVRRELRSGGPFLHGIKQGSRPARTSNTRRQKIVSHESLVSPKQSSRIVAGQARGPGDLGTALT